MTRLPISDTVPTAYHQHFLLQWHLTRQYRNTVQYLPLNWNTVHNALLLYAAVSTAQLGNLCKKSPIWPVKYYLSLHSLSLDYLRLQYFSLVILTIVFSFFTDYNKSVRALSATGHRIQDPVGDVGHPRQGGGCDPAGQVPHEAPGPAAVLPEHGGAGASRRPEDHPRARRRREAGSFAGLPSQGIL